MKNRILRPLAVAGVIVAGVLFGFVTSVAWLILALQMLPPAALDAGDLTLAGIFMAILGVGASCWLCGQKAERWAKRRFPERGFPDQDTDLKV